MRRNLLSTAISAAMLLTGLSAPVLASDNDAIHVGFLTIISGVLASGGKRMEDGLRLSLFEENGGKAAQEPWSPSNVAEYGAYICQIKPNVDTIFAAFVGGNGIEFLKQYLAACTKLS